MTQAPDRRTDGPADEELILRSVAGDRAAFGAIYHRYIRRIYNLVFRMAHRDDDVEDLTQEIFLQVYRNLPMFCGRSTFYTWIYRVASNTCLQYRKKLKRRRDESGLDSMSETEVTARSHRPVRGPEDEAVRRESLVRVLDAIKHLPEVQRLAMVLGPIQGHPYAEMARAMGVSIDVVKGRLHRARRNLQRVLEPLPASQHPAARLLRPLHVAACAAH